MNNQDIFLLNEEASLLVLVVAVEYDKRQIPLTSDKTFPNTPESIFLCTPLLQSSLL